MEDPGSMFVLQIVARPRRRPACKESDENHQSILKPPGPIHEHIAVISIYKRVERQAALRVIAGSFFTISEDVQHWGQIAERLARKDLSRKAGKDTDIQQDSCFQLLSK